MADKEKPDPNQPPPDVVEDEFEKLVGTVVYETDKRMRNIFFITSGALLFILIFGSWFVLLQMRTREEVFQQAIHDFEQIKKVLGEISTQIRRQNISKEDLLRATDRAIDIAYTSLR